MDSRRDVEAEIRFHLEERAAALERAGLSPAEAKAQAAREFGDVNAARMKLERSAGRLDRRARRRRLLDEVRQDVRYGARQLRAHPGFAAIAILTLALGAGATASIFSVVDAVLLRALPWRDAGRLVAVWESHPQRGDHGVVSRGNFMDWRDDATAFSEMAAWIVPFGYTVTGDGPAQFWRGVQVTPSIFGMLGVTPLLGRALEEDESDGIVLSEALWRSRYGGDPAVLGRRVMVEGQPATVVGVMPAGFEFPSSDAEFWLPTPLTPNYRQQRASHTLRVWARLAPGETVASADRSMDALARSIAERWPDEMEGWSVNVVPLRADLTGAVRPVLLVLLGAVALVLLMACANVANLLLTRATVREREVAVRAALGAGRARLVRQFLSESLVLSVAGGALGVGVATVLLRALVQFGPQDVPFLRQARLDGRVLAFTTAVVVGTTLLIGLVPALRAARADLSAMRSQGRVTDGASHRRLRRAILAAEVAFSVILLVAAGLLGRSLLQARSVDPGVSLDPTLAWFSLPQAEYPGTADHLRFYDELLAEVAALPGVQTVGGTSEPPVAGFDMTRSFTIEGRPDAFTDLRSDHRFRLVTPDWFDAVGIPVLAGRGFTSADRADAPPVAIVNRSLARLLFDGDPIGQRIDFGDDRWTEIVGVVEDVRMYGFEEGDRPAIYAPYAQKTWTWLTWMTLGIRSDLTPQALASAVRGVVRGIDPDVPLQRIETVRDVYRASLARRRFQTTLVGAFALLALTLGCIGIYGVAGHAAAQRADEIRMRMVLGARPAEVTRLIVTEELRPTLFGVAAGLLVALGAARLAASQLFGVTTTDLPTFSLSALLLASVSVLAAWLAARRATRGPLRPR